MSKWTVTVIGGGTGSFNILSGLREHDLAIQSIVTMMDSGGDSGELRDAFGVLPPGDVRRCLVALSEEPGLLRDLFSFRFGKPPLAGRNFGNLFFLALTETLGSERLAIAAIGKILKIRGRVLPVTLDHAHLHAELESGAVVRGEANIDRRSRGEAPPAHDPSIPIQRAYLEPEARANITALEAIALSDFIVYAPGDLYTSTVPNLLVLGIPEAIQASGAPLIYVLNLMTKRGETDGWSASRHVAEVIRYGGRIPDAVLAHEGAITGELLERYRSEQAQQVELDAEAVHALGVPLIKRANMMSATAYVRHAPARVAEALLDLFEELEGNAVSPPAARRLG